MKKQRNIVIGQQYDLEGIGRYILATTDGESVCLIHLTSGNRLANPVKVKDMLDISYAEFKLIRQQRSYKKVAKTGMFS